MSVSEGPHRRTVASYRTGPEVFKLFAWLPLILLIAAPNQRSTVVLQDDPAMRGAVTCGGCHRAEYESWIAGPHARALQTLDAARRDDPQCVGCHTTGRVVWLRGVQCESCHGVASGHLPITKGKRRGKRKKRTMQVSEAVCRRCHTADAPKSFDYANALGRIHGTSVR